MRPIAYSQLRSFSNENSHIIYAAIISMQSGKKHGKPTQVLRRTKIKPGSVSGRTTPIPVQVKFMKTLLLKKFKPIVEILNSFFHSLTGKKLGYLNIF